MTRVPLKVLIIDNDVRAAEILAQGLKSINEKVRTVHQADSLNEANSLLSRLDINTIFIDPVSLHIETASSFIFEIRKVYPSITFVLFLDFTVIARDPDEFYSGVRGRFRHYYKLDKNTPIAAFRDELEVTVDLCEDYLAYELTQDKIEHLQSELSIFEKSSSDKTVEVPLAILQDIQEQLTAIRNRGERQQTDVDSKTVFLSYRFGESEYIDGFIILLRREGFSVITGQDANSYISQAIIDRIKSCKYFISLMTRADEKKDGSYTTSSWLLEEKGAALALGKKIVLMVEDGVSDTEGLQGDWQRIHFTSRSFTTAAIKAIDQLKSFDGDVN